MPAPPSARLPRHLAVIMDGNGRWAQRRNRPRTLGHRAGAKAVQVCVDYCLARGIEALTLFAFSSENWNRPEDEVGALMKLFLRMLDSEVEELQRRGVRLSFIGDRSGFPETIRARMAQAEQQAPAPARLALNIAVGYGGRWDIAQACRSLAEDVAAGRLAAADINETVLGERISLAGLPPPDLFIRTGGDLRISNFLLWQLAYAELYFSDLYWPDFKHQAMRNALADYATRQRRFGKTSEQVEAQAASKARP